MFSTESALGDSSPWGSFEVNECPVCDRAEAVDPFYRRELYTRHHAILAAKDTEIERANAKVEVLEDAVAYAAELYSKPTGYWTSKKTWSPNMSIGFETRFEALVEKARSVLSESHSSHLGPEPAPVDSVVERSRREAGSESAGDTPSETGSDEERSK